MHKSDPEAVRVDSEHGLRTVEVRGSQVLV